MGRLALKSEDSFIYFDNGATTFPKPQVVLDSVLNYMVNIGSNPGRSGHELSMESGLITFKLRNLLARMYSIKNPMRCILCFNATDALNLGIKGLLRQGDHVITTSMEHNSVLRPLNYLREIGDIDLTTVSGDSRGFIDSKSIEDSFKSNTKLVVVNHVSNVNGAIQPIKAIGELCRQRGITFLVDASQSGGIIPFDLKECYVDLIALTGHKSLYGPTGTGALLLNDDFNYKLLTPSRHGGTGSLSDLDMQPDFLPDSLESGTLNMAGIAGLVRGIEYLNNYKGGYLGIQNYKRELVSYFVAQAERSIEDFKSYTVEESFSIGIVSFLIEGKSITDLSNLLNESGIMCRQGLHCAPLAHRTLGTFPEGTIRFSFGLFNTKEEIDKTIEVLSE